MLNLKIVDVKGLFEWILSNIGKAVSIFTAIVGVGTFLIGYGMQKANKANDLEQLKKDVQYTKEVVIITQSQQADFITSQTQFNDSISKDLKETKEVVMKIQYTMGSHLNRQDTKDEYIEYLKILLNQKETSEIEKKNVNLNLETTGI